VTTTTVIPTQQSDVAAFHAFAMTCRSKTIYLHFSRSQLLNDDLPRLRAFASALRAHSSNVAPLNMPVSMLAAACKQRTGHYSNKH
jgi:hypothetical protein